jgi:hypothetical protein
LILPQGFESLLNFINALSSITIAEWIELKSTLTAAHNQRFNCNHCLNDKYPGRPEMLEREQTILGCKAAYQKPIHTVGNIKYKKCIGNFTDDSCYNWIEGFEFYEKGVMMFPGCFGEQPAKIIEMMRIIGNFKTEWQLKRAKQKQMKTLGGKRGRQRN